MGVGAGASVGDFDNGVLVYIDGKTAVGETQGGKGHPESRVVFGEAVDSEYFVEISFYLDAVFGLDFPTGDAFPFGGVFCIFGFPTGKIVGGEQETVYLVPCIGIGFGEDVVQVTGVFVIHGMGIRNVGES